MFFFMWMFGAITWQGWWIMQRFRGRGDFCEAFSVATFAGSIACIAIMAFGDWLVPFAYTQTIAGYNYTVYSWLFFGALLALDRLSNETVSINRSEQASGSFL